jgi:tRNA (mo5U34)-methyltransferase
VDGVPHTAEEITERIKGLPWAHPIDFGHGVNAREWYVQRRFQRRLKFLQIPENLAGWSVLDIGAWDGFFSFECERRGADRVLAVDSYVWNTRGMRPFLTARELLNSKVEYKRIDAHALCEEEIGKFDLVLFMGVFYHLRNPLLALERIASVTRKLLICETHLLVPFVHERYPLIAFFPGDENATERKYEMCSIPTLECLKQMLRAVGFGNLEVKHTPSYKYWKKLMGLVTNRPHAGRGIVHARW